MHITAQRPHPAAVARCLPAGLPNCQTHRQSYQTPSSPYAHWQPRVQCSAYMGKGVLTAVKNVNEFLGPAIVVSQHS